MDPIEPALRTLLAGERALHQAYVDYLPLLRPPVLREKLQPGIGEGWKQVEGLESALARLGAASEPAAAIPRELPEKAAPHVLLDFFYQAEERLFYRYQEALQQAADEAWLRALLASHLQNHKRRIAAIQHLYAEFLYY